MAHDALLAALKSIVDENGLQRIDLGYAPYGPLEKKALASIWFEAPEGVIGHAAEWGVSMDDAIEKALATKARKQAPMLEAA